MIRFGIRYLCGWSAATDPASYEAAEWPPHPARVFMALAAAHFATVEDQESKASLEERAALEWLERQAPPAITASAAERPEPLTAFVPVNDPGISSRTDPVTASNKVVAAGVSLLPERRSRQPRTFPRVIPHEDVVWLTWDRRPTQEIERGLARLAQKVSRIGHSTSLVQVWVDTENHAPEPNLIPTEEGDHGLTVRLRVMGEGMLEELERRFELGLRPDASLWQGYRESQEAEAMPHSHFHPDLFIVRLEPAEPERSTLPLREARRIIDGFRGAMISVASEPVPEVLSGHRSDGSPTSRAHLAFLPLPFVDHRHADGHLLGLGLALPRDATAAERTAIFEAVGRLTSGRRDRQLRLGRLGRWRLQPVGAAAPPWSLRSEGWTRPSETWASVTPVVFDRFTKDPDEKRAVIADSCERIGLPRPSEVRLSHISPFHGVPPSPAFGPLDRRSDKPVRPYTHVMLAFAGKDGAPKPVAGPVLIGAGRYRGYGLLRPYDLRRSHPWNP